jgi:hypothetical protein
MESNRPKRCKLRNKKEKIWMDWSHYEKMMEKYQRLPYNGTLREVGTEEDQKNSWRRSVIKEARRSWNELRFLAADRQKWKELVDNLRS